MILMHQVAKASLVRYLSVFGVVGLLGQFGLPKPAAADQPPSPTLEALPNDVLGLVLQNLNNQDLSQTALVSRRFHRVTRSTQTKMYLRQHLTLLQDLSVDSGLRKEAALAIGEAAAEDETLRDALITATHDDSPTLVGAAFEGLLRYSPLKPYSPGTTVLQAAEARFLSLSPDSPYYLDLLTGLVSLVRTGDRQSEFSPPARDYAGEICSILLEKIASLYAFRTNDRNIELLVLNIAQILSYHPEAAFQLKESPKFSTLKSVYDSSVDPQIIEQALKIFESMDSTFNKSGETTLQRLMDLIQGNRPISLRVVGLAHTEPYLDADSKLWSLLVELSRSAETEALRVNAMLRLSKFCSTIPEVKELFENGLTAEFRTVGNQEVFFAGAVQCIFSLELEERARFLLLTQKLIEKLTLGKQSLFFTYTEPFLMTAKLNAKAPAKTKPIIEMLLKVYLKAFPPRMRLADPEDHFRFFEQLQEIALELPSLSSETKELLHTLSKVAPCLRVRFVALDLIEGTAQQGHRTPHKKIQALLQILNPPALDYLLKKLIQEAPSDPKFLDALEILLKKLPLSLSDISGSQGLNVANIINHLVQHRPDSEVFQSRQNWKTWLEQGGLSLYIQVTEAVPKAAEFLPPAEREHLFNALMGLLSQNQGRKAFWTITAVHNLLKQHPELKTKTVAEGLKTFAHREDDPHAQGVALEALKY